MSTEQNVKPVWKYFGRDACSGKVFEIYRCPSNGKRIEQQNLEDVQLLLEDGNWRPNMREILVNEICKGDFNQQSDEISEEEAMNYYQSWRAGDWPGRK